MVTSTLSKDEEILEFLSKLISHPNFTIKFNEY